jgi:competence transcription factor ComK
MELTDAILCILKHDDVNTTIIDRKLEKMTSSESINDVLNAICKRYGLDYETTLRNSRKMMKIRKNPPIILDFQEQSAYFKVISGTLKSQVWLKFTPDIKCKIDKCGQHYLTYRGQFLMNVDFSQRYYRRNYKRMEDYFHGRKNCAILDMIQRFLNS